MITATHRKIFNYLFWFLFILIVWLIWGLYSIVLYLTIILIILVFLTYGMLTYRITTYSIGFRNVCKILYVLAEVYTLSFLLCYLIGVGFILPYIDDAYGWGAISYAFFTALYSLIGAAFLVGVWFIFSKRFEKQTSIDTQT
jgi:hypothetical protein